METNAITRVSTHGDAETLHDAVAAAVLAPSAHNTQPWRFKIGGRCLELYTDATRHLRVIDAERRQLIQSCGCALYNARIAVRAAGYTDEVIPVLDGDEPGHLATLELGPPHITTELEHELFAAISRRHTNRREFLRRPVAPPVVDRLLTAVAAEGATAHRLDPVEKQTIAEWIDQADRQQFDDPAFRAELAQWLTTFGSKRADGIPFVEKEHGSALPFTVMRALRSPGRGTEIGQLEREHVLGSPLVIVLGTAADDPEAWLACGQALQALLLHATAVGLSASFLNQVLEIPELRGRVAELVPSVGYPQMILRLGVPVEGVHHPAPRRKLGEVLDGPFTDR